LIGIYFGIRLLAVSWVRLHEIVFEYGKLI
jgi:hypothetical protein